MAAELTADQLRIGVKRTEQAKTARGKIEVIEQRAAQIARADQNSGALILQAENRAQLLQQLIDIVAVALLSKTAEAVKVLPDLRCGQPHTLGERAGGNALYAFALELADVAVITRQAPDHCF